jgi:hypothetical protein
MRVANLLCSRENDQLFREGRPAAWFTRRQTSSNALAARRLGEDPSAAANRAMEATITCWPPRQRLADRDAHCLQLLCQKAGIDRDRPPHGGVKGAKLLE